MSNFAENRTDDVSTLTVAPEGMEFVEVPARDLFDVAFDGLWNNKTHFPPGRHLVTKELAVDLRDRLRLWEAEQIRQLRPNSDPRVKYRLTNPNAT